jgi:hypothetical protein
LFFDSVPTKDISDRAAGTFVSQIGQRALNSPVTPVAIFFRHANDQGR